MIFFNRIPCVNDDGALLDENAVIHIVVSCADHCNVKITRIIDIY